MRYLPHTREEISSMLQVVGAEKITDLFAAVPDDCRRSAELDLPEKLKKAIRANNSTTPKPIFSVYGSTGSWYCDKNDSINPAQTSIRASPIISVTRSLKTCCKR